MIAKKRILPLLICICIGFSLFLVFSGSDMYQKPPVVADSKGLEGETPYVKLFSNTRCQIQPNPGLAPSIVVDFKGLKGETYYAALLSIPEAIDPHDEPLREADGARYESMGEYRDISLKLASYEDVDGYCLRSFTECTRSHKLDCRRDPPGKYKILIYFPDCDEFVVSAVAYERYAFDSHYIVSVVGTPSEGTAALSVEQKYYYSIPIVPLITSIIVTIALELGIALLFGYRRKKQLKFIFKVNVATQIALSIALCIVNYHTSGGLVFLAFYAIFETVIFAIEAGVYCASMNKYNKYGAQATPKWKTVVYALTANAASFAAGLGLAILIPGLF